MAQINQQGAPLNLLGVAGGPFSLTVDVTAVDQNQNPVPWSDFTNYAVVMEAAFGSQPTGVGPTVTSPQSGQLVIAWTAAQTAAMLNGTWALQVTINGTGPLVILAGALQMVDPTVPGASNSTTTDLTVAVGGDTIALSIQLGSVGSGGGGGAVSSVFGRTGGVVAQTGDYTVGEVTGAAPLASPAFTGTPTAPTAAPLTDDTQIASTAYADAAVAVEKSRAQGVEATLAPLASPALTGSPTAPTKPALTDNTDIATTAYTDAAVAVETTRAEGAEALLAPLASPALTGTPTAPTQATNDSSTKLATTAFVQAVTAAAQAGLDVKPSVAVVAITNQALTGLPTVDGVTLTAGQRILLTGQTTSSQNGIWAVASGAWSRPSDYASGSTQLGAFTFIEAGTVFEGAGWVLAGATTVTVDTSAETWTQFLSSVVAGTGLTRSGNTLSITAIGSATGPLGTAARSASVTINAEGQVTALTDQAISITEGQVINLVSDLAAKAPLASPVFTGTPTAPTPARGTNNTDLATTAFVLAELPFYNPLDHGVVADGVTDDTAAWNALFVTVLAAGGGTIACPGGGLTTRCNGALNPYPAATATQSMPVTAIRITGGGSGKAYSGANGAFTFDLRYSGGDGVNVAKIDCRGSGLFELDHISIKSGGTDDFPIFQTTNTEPNIHDVQVLGHSANSGTSCVQDAFILGGQSISELFNSLSANINASVTSVGFTSNATGPSGFSFVIQVDSEYMLVTAGAGTTTLTVTRGYGGSTAASHTTTSPVHFFAPDGIFQAYGGGFNRVGFNNIRSGLVFQSAANALVVENCTWATSCGGDKTHGAITFNATGLAANGNMFFGNLIEVQNYPYAVVIGGQAGQNKFFGTGLYDGLAQGGPATSIAAVLDISNAITVTGCSTGSNQLLTTTGNFQTAGVTAGMTILGSSDLPLGTFVQTVFASNTIVTNTTATGSHSGLTLTFVGANAGNHFYGTFDGTGGASPDVGSLTILSNLTSNVTGLTVNSATSVTITTAGTWSPGQWVNVAGVVGPTNVNGIWRIIAVGTGTITVQTTAASGTYTSNGTVQQAFNPSAAGNYEIEVVGSGGSGGGGSGSATGCGGGGGGSCPPSSCTQPLVSGTPYLNTVGAPPTGGNGGAANGAGVAGVQGNVTQFFGPVGTITSTLGGPGGAGTTTGTAAGGEWAGGGTAGATPGIGGPSVAGIVSQSGAANIGNAGGGGGAGGLAGGGKGGGAGSGGGFGGGLSGGTGASGGTNGVNGQAGQQPGGGGGGGGSGSGGVGGNGGPGAPGVTRIRGPLPAY